MSDQEVAKQAKKKISKIKFGEKQNQPQAKQQNFHSGTKRQGQKKNSGQKFKKNSRQGQKQSSPKATQQQTKKAKNRQAQEPKAAQPPEAKAAQSQAAKAGASQKGKSSKQNKLRLNFSSAEMTVEEMAAANQELEREVLEAIDDINTYPEKADFGL